MIDGDVIWDFGCSISDLCFSNFYQSEIEHPKFEITQHS